MGEEIHNQQQKLVNKFNQARSRMARNRLILVSILNALTFFSFVFAMAFYEWIYVILTFNFGLNRSKIFYFWVNLLYMKQASSSEYENFGTAQTRICQEDIYCKAVFFSFQFVGYLCFCIFVIAGCLQIFDFIKLCYYVLKGTFIERKDNFRHIVTVFTYAVGLTLSAYSIQIAPSQSHETTIISHFGVSFWLCVVTLVLFIVVIIYEQISIRKVIKQSLIQDLIDKEMETRTKKIKETTNQVELLPTRSDGEEGLTL